MSLPIYSLQTLVSNRFAPSVRSRSVVTVRTFVIGDHVGSLRVSLDMVGPSVLLSTRKGNRRERPSLSLTISK